MFDKETLKKFEWPIFIAVLILSFIGVMTIYSATRSLTGEGQQSFYLKQVFWLFIGLLCFVPLISFDYRWFIRSAYVLFVISVILLIAVIIAGRIGMGAQRWMSIGPFSFQPSEIFKICFVLAISKYLADSEHKDILGLKELFQMMFAFVALPLILILKQPDLGTGLMLLFIFCSVILTVGARKKLIVVTIIIAIVSLPFLGNIVWSGLKDYQKQRLVAFIDPKADPQGTSYHINQSKITIGSGKIFGKGYLKGTQGPLRFLPERHTDFIFSAFAEEWGFAGSVFLFLLYLFIILRGFDTAKKARDPEGRYLALGITYMISFYFIINVGMTLGVVPVVGVPLPFMSYGGTALLSNFIAIGILINVRMRRFLLFY
ncbi:MAG: rod shape-determining protein RodA [Nitrospirae bacterium]|nr:rod shape-determining protein RodA [Nitrospirota bacterium]